MPSNWINIYDVIDLYKIIVDKCFPRNLLTFERRKRIEECWNNRSLDVTKNMKPLNNRFNYLISGDSNVSRFDYVYRKYLREKSAIAVSLGCGSGEHELAWYQTGGFERIDGYDLTHTRINIAKEKAQELGILDRVCFYCKDVQSLSAAPDSYDVVLLESSLHHFSPLKKTIELIQTILKPGGLIFMCDYVGPTKFQWLDKQLLIINSLLGLLPEKYKILSNDRLFNKKIRPSLARMYLNDPSEAIESSKILPLMEQHFETIEFKNAGGAILNHLFPRLAHNFPLDDPEAQDWLQLCIDIEDKFIDKVNDIGYWYAFGVYKVKK